jgi:outer membrane protein
MKRPFLKLLALASGLLLAVSAHAEVKVAVIDLKKVFDGYYRTKQADTQLKERAADFDKARSGLIEDYKKANAEFTKLIESANDQAVSADERDKRKKEVEKKQSELKEQEDSIRKFDANSRQSLGEQQLRMRDSVLKDIRGAIEEKCKASGFQLVVDTAATSVNQTPVVIYTSLLGSENDISDAVLKSLNASAPPEGAKADDKKEPKK